MSFTALVDCNNFFVSCERLFNPKLIGKCVVVLSNNDGCIVARSQEAKALGIPMGAPYFQWADLIKRYDGVVCSSNFPLYADFSHRVMHILSISNPHTEIYSVDEAFLLLDGIKDPLLHCHSIQQKVLQWTGIPISIGIASTKTLSKVANKIAKRIPHHKGVFFPPEKALADILDTLPTSEIWGIGRRLSLRLAKFGIHTAAQLIKQDDPWIRKVLSVTGLRTVWELRGTPAIPLEEVRPTKQSILTSRSFGRTVSSKEELLEAIASFAARAGEKLREEESRATWLSAFIETRYTDERFYANQAFSMFPEPTDFTPTLITHARTGVEKIFRPGFAYKRAGILLGGLTSNRSYQHSLFTPFDAEQIAKKKALMTLLDTVNRHVGHRIVYFAAEGIEREWKSKRLLCSPCYTTRWDELLTISI